MSRSPSAPLGPQAPPPAAQPTVRRLDGHDRFGPLIDIDRLVMRRPARLSGRITQTATLNRLGEVSFEAVLSDGTGSVVLVFPGRREVPGVVPGSRLEACGTPGGLPPGRTEIFNPLYELISTPRSAT